jgi:hypothetical protein
MYGVSGLLALASVYLIWIDLGHWIAPLTTSLGTLVSAGLPIAEKFGVVPGLWANYLFRKQAGFVEARAKEAGREDLLELIECSNERRYLVDCL